MNNKLVIAIASIAVTGALTAGPAVAATTATTTATTKTTTKTSTKTSTKTTTPARRRSSRTGEWEATAGTFRTEKAARARVERLRAHGLPGFVVERERGNRRLVLEVEKPAATRVAAQREAALVRRHGFHAAVERS
jgi:cell division septation protein DedD